MKTEKETQLEAIRSSMRLALTSCKSIGRGKVVVEGRSRLYVDFGIPASFQVFERLEDEVLRHARFKYDLLQPSVIPDVRCTQAEWEAMLDDALKLAKELQLPVTATDFGSRDSDR